MPWTRHHTYIVQSCREASKHQPSEVDSFSYWFDKPWFHTEGRLAAVLIITFSWGFQLGGHLQNSYINTAPSLANHFDLHCVSFYRDMQELPNKIDEMSINFRFANFLALICPIFSKPKFLFEICTLFL
jgi:hypothetical protein